MSWRPVSNTPFTGLMALLLGASALADAPLHLRDHCPPGFELTDANRCELRTLYQNYESLRHAGVGGPKTGTARRPRRFLAAADRSRALPVLRPAAVGGRHRILRQLSSPGSRVHRWSAAQCRHQRRRGPARRAEPVERCVPVELLLGRPGSIARGADAGTAVRREGDGQQPGAPAGRPG